MRFITLQNINASNQTHWENVINPSTPRVALSEILEKKNTDEE